MGNKAKYWAACAIAFIPYTVIGQTMQVYKDGEHTVRVWDLGYDAKYQSHIYADTPDGLGAKQLLTGKVFIQFSNPNTTTREDVAKRYRLTELGKHSVGTGIYVYTYSRDKQGLIGLSQQILKDNTGKVMAAYPDWILFSAYK